MTITGRLLPHAVPGSTPLYVSPESCLCDGTDITVFTRVEDVALRHYMDHGFTQGLYLYVCLCVTFHDCIFYVVMFHVNLGAVEPQFQHRAMLF